MNEVRLYAALVLALMVGAYLSWTAEDEVDRGTKVTLLEGTPDALESVTFYTKSSTVTLTERAQGGDTFGWFEVEGARGKRFFTGNEKVKDLRAAFAPFEALRALGDDLSEEEVKLSGLDAPERSLVITTRGKQKTFEVGKRTSGARDHYVRPAGTDEVYLVAASTLSDLQYPEGKFMQRKLREADKTEVDKLVLTADGRTKTAFQRNRLSPKDAFWANEAEPETPDKTLGNYLDKIERLTATEYADPEAASEARGVLEVAWYGAEGEELGRMALSRAGEGKSATYYATSTATRVPVVVSRFTSDQLESELGSVLGE